MKHSLKIVLLLTLSTMAACGSKKNAPGPTSISEQYKLQSYYAVENKSTLDLEQLQDLPKKVDLQDIMTPVKDQDARGTCSFFSAIALVESAIKRKMNVEVNLSEEYLNYVTKTADLDANTEGSWPENNLYMAIREKKGFLLEKEWPYQPLWFGQKAPCIGVENNSKAPLECFSHNSPPAETLLKIIPGENFKLTYKPKITTNEIIKILANDKEPMTIVVPVNARGWENNGVVSYTKELKQECIDDGSKCGTHAIVLTGYDMDKKVFLFRNSWSKDWGKNGYGEIPFDVIDLYAELAITKVSLISDITLQQNQSDTKFTLESFNLYAKQESDNAITIKTSGMIRNAGFNTFRYGTTLMTESLGSGPLNESNTKVFYLSREDYNKHKVWDIWDAKTLFSGLATSDFEWMSDEDHTYVLPAKLMTTDSVKTSPTRLILRSTLYVYTDDQKYKVVKRYFHGFNTLKTLQDEKQ